MEDRNIEYKVAGAFQNAVPDILDSILSDSSEEKGTITMAESKRSGGFTKRLATVAAALALIIVGAFGVVYYNANYAVSSTVSLDVNPSVEITVNDKERVLNVNALNEDGKKVIGDMDFSGSDIDVTVNALIGSMLRNGYLSDIANSVLVSVEGSDPAKDDQLRAHIAQEIETLLQTNSFSGSVLSQTVSDDSQLRSLADTYGITIGKAQLIKQITDSSPLYQFADLVPLTINELNILCNYGGVKAETVETTGTVSDKSYIGTDAAKNAALNHAGLSESDIYALEIDMEWERGIMVYEVDFKTESYEYEYEINASTGEVVKNNRGYNDDRYDDDYNQSGNTSVGGQTAGGQTGGSQNTSDGTSFIDAAEAKRIALNHAGLSESDIRGYGIETDRDYGVTVYEIEFKSGAYEYDYEINAETGAVIKSHREYDD